MAKNENATRNRQKHAGQDSKMMRPMVEKMAETKSKIQAQEKKQELRKRA